MQWSLGERLLPTAEANITFEMTFWRYPRRPRPVIHSNRDASRRWRQSISLAYGLPVASREESRRRKLDTLRWKAGPVVAYLPLSCLRDVVKRFLASSARGLFQVIRSISYKYLFRLTIFLQFTRVGTSYSGRTLTPIKLPYSPHPRYNG